MTKHTLTTAEGLVASRPDLAAHELATLLTERDRLKAINAELLAVLRHARDELAAVDMLRAKQDGGETIGDWIDAAIAKAEGRS